MGQRERDVASNGAEKRTGYLDSHALAAIANKQYHT
jgi:hypothetical protein